MNETMQYELTKLHEGLPPPQAGVSGLGGAAGLRRERVARDRRGAALLAAWLISLSGCCGAMNDAQAAPLADEVFADPVRVRVRARRDGYRDAEQTIDAARGSTVGVKLAMQVEAAAAGPAAASATASASVAASAGSRGPVVVAPGGPRKEIVVAGASLAGAVVIVGGVLFGVAEKTRGEVGADTPKNPDGSFVCAKQTAPGTADPMCDELRSRARTGNTFGQAGIGLLVAGGLIGLGTAGYALFWPRSQTAPTSSLLPVATPHGAGLVWTGSF